MASCLPQWHSDRNLALALPYETKMASNSKPKKTGRLRSRLQRLFSSPGLRDRRDGEPFAQVLQAPVQDPSLSDLSKGLTPSSGKESRVPVVGTQRQYTGATAENATSSTGASASTSMFSRARNFNVGNLQIDSSQHVHTLNAQDGISVQCCYTNLIR